MASLMILKKLGLTKLMNNDKSCDKYNKFLLVSTRTSLIIFIIYLVLYILVPRRYTVRYLYNLPGEKNTTSISLPEIGNADTSFGSAGYARSTFDPRENYRSIFLSKPVIQNAKRLLNIDYFPKPRIDLTPNSTLISVKITSSTIQYTVYFTNDSKNTNNNPITPISSLTSVTTISAHAFTTWRDMYTCSVPVAVQPAKCRGKS